MKHHLFLIPLLSLTVLTSACANRVEENAAPLPTLTYAHLTPVPVQVANINFVRNTERGAKTWDMANDLPTPPDVALQHYLNQRYRVNGSSGTLELTLDKADIFRDEVANENKILSYIPLADEEDYTFEIIVKLATKYLSGQPDYSTSLRFVRKVRMPLNSTIAYREARLQRTLEEIVRDIDDAMISELSNKFDLILKQNIPTMAIRPKTELPNGDGGAFEQFRGYEQREVDPTVTSSNTERAKTVQPVVITPLPAKN